MADGADEQRPTKRGSKGKPLGPAGTIIRMTRHHGPQLMRTNGYFWSDEAEAIFLDGLAATANVSRSAQASGFTVSSVYFRRRRDAAFAERWNAALATGYSRLETALLRSATDTIEGAAHDPEAPMPPVTVAEAINILRLHKTGAAEHRAARGSYRRRPKTLDEVRHSILNKLEAIVAMSEEEAAASDE